MTKCDDMLELIAEYSELPENDPNRILVDEHVKECASCREQLELWLESAALIQTAAAEVPEPVPVRGSVSESVMKRIYAEESWRIPVAERLYRIPYRLRIRLLTLVSACLALFGCSMLFRMLPPELSFGRSSAYGVVSINALGGNSPKFAFTWLEGVPVASIGDPVVLGMSISQYPDYYMALSLIGIVCSLLTLNWLSRLQS